MFMNLLVNAVHAIGRSGSVTISTRVEDNAVVVAFTDTGRGITSDQLSKIFDPGYTTKGVGVGSGLRLAICYKIVQDHGGTIDVEPEVGRGSTFTVRLPLESSANSQHAIDSFKSRVNR